MPDAVSIPDTAVEAGRSALLAEERLNYFQEYSIGQAKIASRAVLSAALPELVKAGWTPPSEEPA